MQATVLAEQESEMLASGNSYATIHEAAACSVGDQVVGIVEQREVEPGFRYHTGRVGTQAL